MQVCAERGNRAATWNDRTLSVFDEAAVRSPSLGTLRLIADLFEESISVRE